MAGRGKGRLHHAGAGGAARRRGAGQGRGPCRLHQRGAGEADPEIAAAVDEGRSGFGLILAGLTRCTDRYKLLESLTRRYLMSRPPLPPFTRETDAQKAHMEEDDWNSSDPVRV